jgi:hypothetical protein
MFEDSWSFVFGNMEQLSPNDSLAVSVESEEAVVSPEKPRLQARVARQECARTELSSRDGSINVTGCSWSSTSRGDECRTPVLVLTRLTIHPH